MLMIVSKWLLVSGDYWEQINIDEFYVLKYAFSIQNAPRNLHIPLK
jgi:hypothetical protein